MVVGGVVSTAADNFAVIFGDDKSSDGLRCTGVVVAPRVILTARHCVSTMGANPTGCKVGDVNDLNFRVAPTNTKDPKLFVVATGASPGGPRTGVYATQIDVDDSMDASGCWRDLAVVTLNKALSVPVVTPRATPVSVGEKLRIVGYGAVDNDGTIPTVRQSLEGIEVLELGVTTVGQNIVNDGEILTSLGFCNGDSGGPLLDSTGALVGLVSRKTGPCTTAKNIYTSMKHVTPILARALARIEAENADAGAPVADAGVADVGSPESDAGKVVPRREAGVPAAMASADAGVPSADTVSDSSCTTRSAKTSSSWEIAAIGLLLLSARRAHFRLTRLRDST